MILVSKDLWKIKPSSSKQSHYTIEKVLDKCSCTLNQNYLQKIEIAIINCLTLDAVKAGETHLKNALKVLESINETDVMKLKVSKRIAPNLNRSTFLLYTLKACSHSLSIKAK